MSNQIARVNWNRGQYSDVFRSAIVDPSPLKEGQKIRVIWGKGKKEHSATLRCYPVIEEPAQEPNTENDLQPRQQAKAKRKLISEAVQSPDRTKKARKAENIKAKRKPAEKPKGKRK